MRIDGTGKLIVSERELCAMLVKLRDPGSGRGFEGAYDARIEATNREAKFYAEPDIDAMNNTPDGINPEPIIAHHHRCGLHIIETMLATMNDEIRKTIHP